MNSLMIERPCYTLNTIIEQIFGKCVYSCVAHTATIPNKYILVSIFNIFGCTINYIVNFFF